MKRRLLINQKLYLFFILPIILFCNLYSLTLDEELYATGVVDYMIYDKDLAQKKMLKVLEISENDEYKSYANYYLGLIAYENKDYQNALQYFEDANELSYKLYGERDYAYTGHIIQMKYLLKDSSYEKDRDSLLTIWQPNSDIVKNLKVHFLININEIEKAIDLISDIQRENSEEPYFYLLKAIIYCRENELKKSIMFFTKALEHKDNQDKPDFEPFMYYWGSIIYYKDDNIDLAQEYFNKAIQFEDDSYKIRGIALMYMHSFKEDEFEILRYLDNNNE